MVNFKLCVIYLNKIKEKCMSFYSWCLKARLEGAVEATAQRPTWCLKWTRWFGGALNCPDLGSYSRDHCSPAGISLQYPRT